MLKMYRSKQSGFTLVETGIVIVVTAIVLAGALVLMKPYVSDAKLSTTKIKEQNISDALALFAQAYGRLPCPANSIPGAEPFGAPRNSGANGTNVEASCGVDTNAQNFTGILPFKALKLSEEQAKDSYGNFFTYAVHPAMTKFNINNPSATTIQPACATTNWVDVNNVNKNPLKANLCCPVASAGTPGMPIPGAPTGTSYPTTPIPDQVKICYSVITLSIQPDGVTQTGQMKESNSTWSAPGNTVETGRYHSGDENGQTTYVYATLKAVDSQGTKYTTNATITVDSLGWEQSHKESDAVYIARGGTVIVGRQHSGDENGQTSYETGFIEFNGRRATLNGSITSPSIKESSGILYVAPSGVLIARIHSGDENGQTTYAYSTVSAQAALKTTTTTHADGSSDVASAIDPSVDPAGTLPACTTTGWSGGNATAQSGTGQANGGGNPQNASQGGALNRIIAFYLISHGANGDGALQKNSGRRPITAPANSAEAGNYSGDFTKYNVAPYSTSNNASYFDDIVLSRTNDQLVSGSCSSP
jgi:type II secretory pathway pseudopilin PulG